MKKRIMEFLKLLESALPPPEGAHHSITFAQYGSDDAGWDDRLALGLREGGTTRIVFLEDGDLERPPSELVTEITQLVSTNA